MYIAEQQMVAAAVGMQVLGWKTFSSTFAAFLSRAYDFVRMAAVSRATLRLCGSHAGVSIGEDGPSQMGLEDIAEFRAIHGSTVLYPCDGNQTTALVRAMGDIDGISYLRTTRGDTPVVYGADEHVPGRRLEDAPRRRRRRDRRGRHHRARGGARGRDARRGGHRGTRDRLLLGQADRRRDALRGLRMPIVTVEDHWAEGGLGEAVLSALAESGAEARVTMLAVRELAHSGKPAELLAAAGIDADHIADGGAGARPRERGRRLTRQRVRQRRRRPQALVREPRRVVDDRPVDG